MIHQLVDTVADAIVRQLERRWARDGDGQKAQLKIGYFNSKAQGHDDRRQGSASAPIRRDTRIAANDNWIIYWKSPDGLSLRRQQSRRRSGRDHFRY